jgi:hypothetical protein
MNMNLNGKSRLLMFPPPFQRLSVVAALIVLVGFESTSAQNTAGGLPAELAPLAAKYQSDLDALGAARSKAVAMLRQSYLTALGVAEKKATGEGKLDELKALAEEKQTVASGQPLPPKAAPFLPSGVATPRAYLLREMARADHEYNVHAQESAAQYLRGLAFYENKARGAEQIELLKQIEAEKARVTGRAVTEPIAAAGAEANLVLNGDFAQKNDDETPANWSPGGPGRGALSTEQGTAFLRRVSADTKEAFFLQNIDRPAGAQEVKVSVRLRCREVKNKATYGVVVAQRDSNGKLSERDLPCDLFAAAPSWKVLSGVVKIRPETKILVVKCAINGGAMAVDFADVRVEAR